MLLSAAAVLALIANPACANAPAGSELARHLKATVDVESGGDTLVIGINADPIRHLPKDRVTSRTPAEATAKAIALLAQGRRIDLGLMQISDAQLARHHLTLTTVFDACANIKAGAEHLADDLAWVLAHQRFNCGRIDCGEAYAMRIEAKLDSAPPVPPPSLPCAPAWDAWALASCTQAPTRQADGASSVSVPN